MITNSILPLRGFGRHCATTISQQRGRLQPLRDRFLGRPRFDDWAVFAGFIGLFRCSLPAPVSLEACLSRGVSATQVQKFVTHLGPFRVWCLSTRSI